MRKCAVLRENKKKIFCGKSQSRQTALTVCHLPQKRKISPPPFKPENINQGIITSKQCPSSWILAKPPAHFHFLIINCGLFWPPEPIPLSNIYSSMSGEATNVYTHHPILMMLITTMITVMMTITITITGLAKPPTYTWHWWIWYGNNDDVNNNNNNNSNNRSGEATNVHFARHFSS